MTSDSSKGKGLARWGSSILGRGIDSHPLVYPGEGAALQENQDNQRIEKPFGNGIVIQNKSSFQASLRNSYSKRQPHAMAWGFSSL